MFSKNKINADYPYSSLVFLDKGIFPKKCSCCGKQYSTFNRFLIHTHQVNHLNGFLESVDKNKQVIVQLHRNCPCGTTFFLFLKRGKRKSKNKKIKD